MISIKRRENLPLLERGLLNERIQVTEYGKRLLSTGLTHGTGGNVSLCDRKQEQFAISPSGMDYNEILPMDVVVLDFDGKVVEGQRKPSSEYPLHAAIYRAREDISAIIHVHSVYAGALCCLGQDLPPLHYLVGLAGPDVRCAPYEPYGSEALGARAVQALEGRLAVLLANHGLVACGSTLAQALTVAEEIEYCCKLYCIAKSMGTPALLGDGEMRSVIEHLKGYGQNRT